MSVDKYFNLNNKSKQKEKEEEKINQSFGQPFFFFLIALEFIF